MVEVDDLSCSEFVALVTDYLEGALSDSASIRFERHLVDCQYCDTYLDQMRVTISATGRITEDDLTPEAREALLTAFRTWKTGCGADTTRRPHD